MKDAVTFDRAMTALRRNFPIGLSSAVLVTSQLLVLAPRTHAATDANGNALPGSGDEKSIVIDNSKEKESTTNLSKIETI